MDNSETYMRMSDKLPDNFPDKYVLHFGDYYYDRNKKEVCIHFESALAYLVRGEVVKLHRQDQLQEMYGDFGKCLDWIHDFQCPECNYSDGKVLSFTSREQLWLAFLVKEKYNKTWNGEDWV